MSFFKVSGGYSKTENSVANSSTLKSYYTLSRCHCRLFYKHKSIKKGFSEQFCYLLVEPVFSCQRYRLFPAVLGMWSRKCEGIMLIVWDFIGLSIDIYSIKACLNIIHANNLNHLVRIQTSLQASFHKMRTLY